MSRRFIGVASVIIGLPLCTFANFGSSSKGDIAASFLKLGVGARAIGLGEAYSALADDASALYWNPAALSEMSNPSSLALMHASYVDSSFFDYFSLAHTNTNGH